MKTFYYLLILAPAVVAACILLFRSAPEPEAISRFTETIPHRQPDAPTGSQFVEQTRNMLGQERDVAI
jgi:hypothetical protein